MSEERARSAVRRGSAATIDRILLFAEAEFAAHGLAAGRVQEIAREAGVTKQLVYHYFTSKEELYQSVLEVISDRYDDQFKPEDYDCLSPEDAIRRFTRRHFRLHAGNGGNLLRDVAQYSGDGLRSSRRRHKLVAAVSSCLDRILERGRAAGDFTGRIDTPSLLLMVNLVTNGAVATGSYLIGLISEDVPCCPVEGSLQDLCAEFVLLALASDRTPRLDFYAGLAAGAP